MDDGVACVAEFGRDNDEGIDGRFYMHIITRKRLNEFADLHPTSRTALSHWFQIVKKNNFNSFIDLRKSFANADQVGGLTVFNIGGNKARLVAAIHYNRRKIYVRAILTHEQYNTGKWKE